MQMNARLRAMKEIGEKLSPIEQVLSEAEKNLKEDLSRALAEPAQCCESASEGSSCLILG